MTTDTPAAAPITAERLREALTLAREYVLSATYRPDSNNFIRSEASRRLAIIDAALSAPVAAPLPLAIQPWPPGTNMLQVAVAPNAAAGPYPTAMRPATTEEVAAMQQRFAPSVSVAAQPADSAMDSDDLAILEAVRRELDRQTNRGNAPGHGHEVPGIWDYDNGQLAGLPCAWCLTWKKFTALIDRDRARALTAASKETP
jgi:hypothetical protein